MSVRLGPVRALAVPSREIVYTMDGCDSDVEGVLNRSARNRSTGNEFHGEVPDRIRYCEPPDARKKTSRSWAASSSPPEATAATSCAMYKSYS